MQTLFFFIVGLPAIIIYLREKRNKINSKKKNIKYFLKKFFWINFTFKGRISRYEFFIYGWWMFVGVLLLVIAFASQIFVIFYVVLWIVHQYAVYIKRLHDLNKSGWNILWSFIPILGYLYIFVICFCFKGTEGSNDYGPDPNADQAKEYNFPSKLLIWLFAISMFPVLLFFLFQ